MNSKGSFFDKEDIEELYVLNEFSNDSSKRVFMVKLRLSCKVIWAKTPMIYDVLGIEDRKDIGMHKMESVGKRSACKAIDKEIEKEVYF